MRKSPLIALVLIIVLAIFSAPYFFGMFAEKQIRQFVQTIGPNSDVKVAIQSYKRGWFKSDVNFTVQVNSSQIHRLVSQITNHPLDSQLQNIVLNGTTTIYHGPIIFINKQLMVGKAAMVFNTAISPESQKALMNSLTGTFPNASGIAKVGFGDELKITLNTSALNLQQKNTGNSAQFSELKGSWKINLKEKFIDGSYQIESLGLTGNGMTLNMETLQASYQGEGEIFNITPHLGIMNETVKVPHAVVQQNQKTIFELKDGKLFNQSVLKDNKYDVTQIIEVDKAILDDKTYGPGRYIVVFKHIDPATANQFIRQLNSLKTATSDKERNYLALAGVSSFAQFFTKGAELELSFDLITPEGPIAARSQAAFNQDAAANTANMQAGMDFIKKLKLNFEVKLPIALTEKVMTSINEQYLEHQKTVQKEGGAAQQQPAAPNTVPSLVDKSEQDIEQMAQQSTKQQLLQLTNSGAFVENNGSYQMNIQLKDGQLLVNGKNIQNTTQAEPGVTTIAPNTATSVQPSAPIMMLAPNAVKSSNMDQSQPSAATVINPASPSVPGLSNTTTITPSANPANQPQAQTAPVAGTSAIIKKTSVGQ